MEIGTIKAVHILAHEKKYVTAELELNVKGVNYSFGGGDIFLTGDQGGRFDDPPFLGRFIFRCLQICKADSWDLLKSCKVLVQVIDKKVVAIGNVTGDQWFNPVSEFDHMLRQKERENA